MFCKLDSKRDAQSRKQQNDEHAENKNNENAIPNIAPIVPDAKEKIRQEPESKCTAFSVDLRSKCSAFSVDFMK